MEENKNTSCCSGGCKKWLPWIIGAVVIMMVFCAGLAAGRFSSFVHYGQYGYQRDVNQQGGFYGRGMMRGGRYYDNYAPTEQAPAATDQTAPATTTTVPVK